ncbi:MAG: GntR family transcriptional regulator [Anaerolineales bacterium]|nr:GntR family transcriptional regulator [Anaerolineales bacterium]
MPIQLTRQNDQPLYLQVAEQLRQQIESGELTPQTRLPASRIWPKSWGSIGSLLSMPTPSWRLKG